MAALNRTAQIVGYLLSHSGAVGHTRLLKLLYLADLESRRLRGRPISDLRYRFHHFGPFDPGIYAVVGELERDGLAEERTIQHRGGKVERQVVALGDLPRDAIDPVDEHILAYVSRTYARLPLDDLLKIVYETAPMKEAVRGRSISMEAENN